MWMFKTWHMCYRKKGVKVFAKNGAISTTYNVWRGKHLYDILNEITLMQKKRCYKHNI